MLRIEVTQEDIDAGQKSRLESCPIALAANRQTNCGQRVRVTVESLRVSPDPLAPAGERVYRKYALPDEAVTFIQKYDSGDPVEPYSFEATAT